MVLHCVLHGVGLGVLSSPTQRTSPNKKQECDLKK